MKHIFNIIYRLLIVLIFVIMILMISSMLFDNKNNIFGYSGFIVLSDSMKKTDFDAGDLIIVKKVDFKELKDGDIISYISQNSDSYMDIITHKIRSKTINEFGEVGFITYGTTTGVDDEVIVTYPYIVGKYRFRIPKVGLFLSFIKTIPGYIIFVVIPFLLIMFMQVINTIKCFIRYKRVQINKLKLEKRKIEKERQDIERMIQELQQLKNDDSKSDINLENSK